MNPGNIPKEHPKLAEFVEFAYTKHEDVCKRLIVNVLQDKTPGYAAIAVGIAYSMGLDQTYSNGCLSDVSAFHPDG